METRIEKVEREIIIVRLLYPKQYDFHTSFRKSFSDKLSLHKGSFVILNDSENGTRQFDITDDPYLDLSKEAPIKCYGALIDCTKIDDSLEKWIKAFRDAGWEEFDKKAPS